jgi:hypothetical protein
MNASIWSQVFLYLGFTPSGSRFLPDAKRFGCLSPLDLLRVGRGTREKADAVNIVIVVHNVSSHSGRAPGLMKFRGELNGSVAARGPKFSLKASDCLQVSTASWASNAGPHHRGHRGFRDVLGLCLRLPPTVRI